jgi:hypothetical protein
MKNPRRDPGPRRGRLVRSCQSGPSLSLGPPIKVKTRDQVSAWLQIVLPCPHIGRQFGGSLLAGNASTYRRLFATLCNFSKVILRSGLNYAPSYGGGKSPARIAPSEAEKGARQGR